MPDPTNTLILTGFSSDKLEDKKFIGDLQQEIIESISVSDIIQFIILKSFKRIVIIFDDIKCCIKIHDLFQKHTDFKAGYSFNNYTHDVSDNYLKLPNNSRMFLISPPASPPADFDYDQTEEEPNKSQIYTHEELQEIFLKNNNELRDILESNQKKTKYTETALKSLEEFEKEIILSDSTDDSKPKIILHPIVGDNDHLIGKAIQSFKTSLPPRSIFDDLSDNEYDDDEE